MEGLKLYTVPVRFLKSSNHVLVSFATKQELLLHFHIRIQTDTLFIALFPPCRLHKHFCLTFSSRLRSPLCSQYYLYCCLLAMLGVIVFVRTSVNMKVLLLTLAVVVYLALFIHVYAPKSYCLIDLLYNDTK